ncbi:MAG: 2-oxo acid dehydrogenase subunit E2 [Anaerolineae bacterium]|nr:2-oxo acid dehydrogenase subunit E2 [Anaerolineae bacterium]
MSETITMPALGVDMQQGTFLNWLKQVGDEVKAGDVIAEIEADKATVEIQAPANGILMEKKVNPGESVYAGMELGRVGAPEELKGYAPMTDVSRQPELETEQAYQRAPTEDEIKLATQTLPAVAPPSPVAAPQDGNVPGGIKASPVARRMAEERGIDLKLIAGTGPGGRITKSDVEKFQPTAARPAPTPAAAAAQAPAQAAAPAAPAPAQAPAPTPTVTRTAPTGPDITEEPVSRMRQRIAARTIESKTTIPHFYLTMEVDMAAALALRKQINASLPEEQKVTVNDLVVKAAALALRKFPNLNSHYYGDKLVRHGRINIGIAVSLEGGGLMNVVARDADSTSISRLAQRNKELITAARSGKIRLEDLEGATFTVSNLGPYNVEHFEAIISPPEAAILAVATARDVPVVVDGEIKIGNRMKLSLSVDHRVSDGVEGAEFLSYVRELLEQPMRLLV